MKIKQKKRIKDTAFMVRNVLNMSENMTTMNTNYAADLEEFVLKLKEKVSGADAPDVNCSDHKPEQKKENLPLVSTGPSDPDSDSRERREEEQEVEDLRKPKKTKKPPAPWAKDLYRKIMMKCHPDRNQQPDMSDPMSIVYRSEAMNIATQAYKDENFESLVYAGAIVDVFSTRLSANKQIQILNSEYEKRSHVISEVQGSISWNWGINWDTVEARIRLVERICLTYGIPLPKKEELELMLNEHEMK